MKLSEFKKKLNELEVKLLLEHKLNEDEIEVVYYDIVGMGGYSPIEQLEISNMSYNNFPPKETIVQLSLKH